MLKHSYCAGLIKKLALASLVSLPLAAPVLAEGGAQKMSDSTTNKSAASATQPAAAQVSGGTAQTDSALLEFDAVDIDNNDYISWEEVDHRYDDYLSNAGWDKQQVLDRFDSDNNNRLDKNEYIRFTEGLTENVAGIPGAEPRVDLAPDPVIIAFIDLDADNNAALGWNEIDAGYGDQLSQMGWGEQQVMNQFDQNRDQALDENEYLILTTGIAAQSAEMADRQATGQAQSAAEPRSAQAAQQ